jgi:hypothetical protein
LSCCGFSFGHFLLAILKRKMKTAGKNSQPFVGEVPQQHYPEMFGFGQAKVPTKQL